MAVVVVVRSAAAALCGRHERHERLSVLAGKNTPRIPGRHDAIRDWMDGEECRESTEYRGGTATIKCSIAIHAQKFPVFKIVLRKVVS